MRFCNCLQTWEGCAGVKKMIGEDILKQKVKYFLDNKQAVHISLKNSRFLNGIILEFAGDLLIIDDQELGATPVYIMEIKYIDNFREKKDGNSREIKE